MFNFFRLPFGVKSRTTCHNDLRTEFETGILANLFRWNNHLSAEDIEYAHQVTAREMKALKNCPASADSNEFYEKMTASLRRIENDLKKF